MIGLCDFNNIFTVTVGKTLSFTADFHLHSTGVYSPFLRTSCLIFETKVLRIQKSHTSRKTAKKLVEGDYIQHDGKDNTIEADAS